MEIDEYQKKSLRTMNCDLFPKEKIANMIFGLNGEIGEVTDLFKKHLFHGHDLDLNDFKLEMGDIMFYWVNLLNLFDIDAREIFEMNVNKLLKRYPDGFDKQKSINRED